MISTALNPPNVIEQVIRKLLLPCPAHNLLRCLGLLCATGQAHARRLYLATILTAPVQGENDALWRVEEERETQHA